MKRLVLIVGAVIALIAGTAAPAAAGSTTTGGPTTTGRAAKNSITIRPGKGDFHVNFRAKVSPFTDPPLGGHYFVGHLATMVLPAGWVWATPVPSQCELIAEDSIICSAVSNVVVVSPTL